MCAPLCLTLKADLQKHQYGENSTFPCQFKAHQQLVVQMSLPHRPFTIQVPKIEFSVYHTNTARDALERASHLNANCK